MEQVRSLHPTIDPAAYRTRLAEIAALPRTYRHSARRRWCARSRARKNKRCPGCTTSATSSCRRSPTAGSASALPRILRRYSRLFRILPLARHIAARSRRQSDRVAFSRSFAVAPEAPHVPRCRSAACRWSGRRCKVSRCVRVAVIRLSQILLDDAQMSCSGPDDAGLPPGSGLPKQRKAVYTRKCLACHGEKKTRKPNDPLVGGRGTLAGEQIPIKTVGSFWPCATTILISCGARCL
jgi:hypothetical protein